MTFISKDQVAPGHLFMTGDKLDIDLFGVKTEIPISQNNFEGIEIEIKPRYGVSDETICFDCKGSGVIELFNSTVPCKCRGG